MKLGVLVVDVQPPYFSSSFTWRNPFEQRRFVRSWKTVLQTFQDEYCVFVEMDCGETTIDALRKVRTAPVFTKGCTDAFENMGVFSSNDCTLQTYLKKALDREKIDTLIIGGLYGHQCVCATATGAAKKGYDVHLAWDLIDQNMNRDINFYKQRTTIHETHRELIKKLHS